MQTACGFLVEDRSVAALRRILGRIIGGRRWSVTPHNEKRLPDPTLGCCVEQPTVKVDRSLNPRIKPSNLQRYRATERVADRGDAA